MKIVYLFTFIAVLASAAASRAQAPLPDKERLEKVIRFYPNPATSIINFDMPVDYDKSYNLQIFSFVGKKVYEINNIPSKTVVNLNNFYRGIYIFQLRDRTGKIIESGKFQVSR